MPSLWTLTKKNIKLLLRAKGSALIVIFAPLLVILLLGLSFNTSEQFGLKIGVHSTAFTDDVESFTALLDEEFSTTSYDSIETCISDIKSAVVHTCISLPENLQVESNEQKEVTFYVDASRVNLVWMIQETVKSKFNLKSQEISQELTQNIVSRLTSTKNGLNTIAATVESMQTKGSSTSSATEEVAKKLSALDLSTTTTQYNLSTTSDISSALEDGRDLISDSITAVQGSGLSDAEKESISDTLKKARGRVTTALNALSGTGDIGGLIASLQNDLDEARSKLSLASQTISSSKDSLTGATNSLAEINAGLASLQSEIQKMQENLNTLKVTDAGTISSPFVTHIERVSEEGTYLNYLFPAILVLVIMFSSLLLGTTLVMIEKNSPAFFRNFFLPVKKITFITSIYITNLLLIIIQILVILGISLFFLENVVSVLPTVALILFITASVFTFIGMAVGYLFTSEETAILGSISLGSVLLFFSGTILPLEGLSNIVRDIAAFNPFVIAEKLVREVFIFGTSLTAVWVDVVILAGYAIAFFLLILFFESVLHRQLTQKFMRHHHHRHRQMDKKKKIR